MPKNYNLYLKGYVGDWNFSADMVNAVLDKHKDKEVCVLIDSTGGRVDTALSISSLFKLHGNVHCHYVGMNASAATIAFLLEKVREEHLPAVWYIEFSNHLVADGIAEAAGVDSAMFHTCHNVSKADLEAGATYLSLMEGNLEALRARMH